MAASSAQADGKVIALSGALTSRPAGVPAPGSPAGRQLSTADVRVVPDDDLTTAEVTLKAVPAAGEGAYLRLVVGKLSGATCFKRAEYSTPTDGSPSAGWSRSGATYTLASTAESLVDDLDCAFAAVASDASSAPTATYDVLIGALRPEYAQPALQVAGVELLGSPRLRLVPGVWTTLDVVVRNTGTAGAGQVVVSGKAAGKGKGLNVKAGAVPYEILPGSTGVARIRVKLTRSHAVKLALTVSGGGAQAAGMTWIKPGKAPARLRTGTYRSKDKAVVFRVKGTKIVGFRIRTQTTCGGFPDLPTYTTNWYDMPTAKVSRAGIVDAVDRTSLYTATLRGKAKGNKVKAEFTYGGPDRCRASASFVARRVG